MKLSLEIITIIEAIYIIYVLNYFKTRYSIAHPLTYFDDPLFYHPIGKSKEPISNICQFGHQASWYLAIYLIIRYIMIYHKYVHIDAIKCFSWIILSMVIIGSLLNFNAVLYLLPVFILEYFLIINNFSM